MVIHLQLLDNRAYGETEHSKDYDDMTSSIGYGFA